MSTLTVISNLLGGLGLFFFGMKITTDGLQAVFGDVIRKLMAKMSTHPFKSLLAGLFVTSIIQSSSITTVMAVGLVNAGVMGLKQAIGIIFGANIGTSITGWFFTLYADVNAWAFVGIGFLPAMFAKTNRFQQWGKSLLGLGLVLLGLLTMKNIFVELVQTSTLVENLSFFHQTGVMPVTLTVIIGMLLTTVAQSSAVMIGLTMLLASSGIISLAAAVALVIGENIGTTMGAMMASLDGTTSAKRAARIHIMFNVFGAVIMLVFFEPFMHLVQILTPGLGQVSFYEIVSAEYASSASLFVAMTHTLFNLITAVIFFPLINQLGYLVVKITPDRPNEREVPHLLMLGNPQDLVPATSIVQAESEVIKLSDIVERMFKLTKEYWSEPEFEPKKFSKILDYERITDNIHKELTIFLCYVMEKPLSHHQSEQTQALIKIADELESVADYLERLAHYRERFKLGENLEGESRKEFFDFMEEVHQFYEKVMSALIHKQSIDLATIQGKSEELQVWADSIRDKHLERIAKGVYQPVTALTFSDMVVALRKIRTHSLHLANGVHNLNTEAH
jgi:phosphate:Na+ symporter